MHEGRKRKCLGFLWSGPFGWKIPRSYFSVLELEPRLLPQGLFVGYGTQTSARRHFEDISSNRGISNLGWCLGLEIKVLRLKMTLKLFV